MELLWDLLVRLRTWILGIATIIAILLPDLLPLAASLINDPKIVAILPEGWSKYAGAIGTVLTIWSRWRPATRASDPEVKVAKAIKETDLTSTIIVKEDGETKAVIQAPGKADA